MASMNDMKVIKIKERERERERKRYCIMKGYGHYLSLDAKGNSREVKSTIKTVIYNLGTCSVM